VVVGVPPKVDVVVFATVVTTPLLLSDFVPNIEV